MKDKIDKILEEGDRQFQDEIDSKKSENKGLSRDFLIEELNEILEENDGQPFETEDERIIDLGLDSFGMTMFFLELDDRYSYFKGYSNKEEFMKNIDWEKLTLNDIIERILCI